MDSELEEFGPEIANVQWGSEYSQLANEIPQVFGTTLNSDAWRVGYSPFESQEAFHALTSTYKGFSGPVGSGKSAALCREAIRLALANPGCDGLIGAPTYTMLADVTRAAFLEALEAAGIKHRFKAQRNLVYLPDVDVKVFFRSLSDPRKLVGKNLAWAGIDELTFCLEASWKKIEARLRHPKAKRICGFAVWTPAGFDWVYNRFRAPEKKLPRHEAIFAKPFENKAILDNDPEYYDRLKTSYDARMYQQEALGEYLNIFAGQAYYAFDRARNVKPVEFDWRLPLCWAMDFNVARMSSVIAQGPRPGHKTEEIRVLDEIVLTNSHTAATCEEFLERLDRLTKGTPLEHDVVQVRIYGDAAGDSRTSKTDKTDYAIVRQWGARNAHRVQLSFQVQDANPSVRGRIASTNALFCNEAGDARTLIAPGCKLLAEDCEQVGWAEDAHGNQSGELDKKNPALTHVSDAFGYLVWKEAGIRQRGGSVSKTNLRY